MKVSISRTYTFSAAHRIAGHPKCGRMHGHNYEVVIELTGEVPADGMLMDYGEMDRLMKPLFDNLDHRYLSNETEQVELADMEVRILMIPATTAEYLAGYIFDWANGTGALHGLVSAVTVKEGGKSSATVRAGSEEGPVSY